MENLVIRECEPDDVEAVHPATMDLDRVLKFYRNRGFRTWCLEMFI